jgi:hypothetical protein
LIFESTTYNKRMSGSGLIGYTECPPWQGCGEARLSKWDEIEAAYNRLSDRSKAAFSISHINMSHYRILGQYKGQKLYEFAQYKEDSLLKAIQVLLDAEDFIRPDPSVVEAVFDLIPNNKKQESKNISLVKKYISMKNNYRPRDRLDAKSYRSHIDVINRIAELYESASGRVKLFLRKNNPGGVEIGGGDPLVFVKGAAIVENQLKYTHPAGEEKTTKKVTKVTGVTDTIDPEEDNAAAYGKMKTTFETATKKEGQNILLVVYGFSGSGKTFTLFGQKNGQTGVVQHMINDALDNSCEVTLERCYELYGKVHLEDSGKSKIITYEIEYETETANGTNIANFRTYYEAIEERRENTGIDYDKEDPSHSTSVQLRTIKKTPNNDHSSRGHLFMKFKIFRAGWSTHSYITIIDMAGAEDPFVIAKMCNDGSVQKKTQLFSTLTKLDFPRFKDWLLNTDTNDKKMNPGRKQVIEESKFSADECPNQGQTFTQDQVREIVREGFFINQTIRLLSAFVKGLITPKTKDSATGAKAKGTKTKKNANGATKGGTMDVVRFTSNRNVNILNETYNPSKPTTAFNAVKEVFLMTQKLTALAAKKDSKVIVLALTKMTGGEKEPYQYIDKVMSFLSNSSPYKPKPKK